MNQYLALTILAENQPNVIALLTKFFALHHAQIYSTRVLTLGNELAVMLLVKAAWNQIVKIETQLPHLATENNLLVQVKRIELNAPDPEKWLSYSAEFISSDPGGIIEAVTSFFLDIGALIHEISDNHYTVNYTGLPMYSLSMRILLPKDILLSDLREQFATLVDFLNIDAYLEPERA